MAQSVYERGTFTSLPAGKHINHSYYGTWKVFFAVEDGVLIYDHQLNQWSEPITASNGLNQYPALLVWEDQGSRNVWIVTPDYVFVYDPLTDWMSRQTLPIDNRFSGKYEIGITDSQVIITAKQEGASEGYSAVYEKGSGLFNTWGQDSTINIDWVAVEPIETFPQELKGLYESLGVQTITNGSFDGAGLLHLDGYPLKSASQVSALSGSPGAGEVFLSTYGMGIFYQQIRGASFTHLPFGLLSPDVMCLENTGDQIIVGGRAGLTFLDDFKAHYEEAQKDPVFDYSFISAIDTRADDVLIAARGGVFKNDKNSPNWERIVSKKDLASTRIYSIAAGNDGGLVIGTERNAYLYHDSGLILQTLFPEGTNWPVFDITHADSTYYISTYFGLYIYDETISSFVARINSHGEVQSPKIEPAVDPVYKCELQNETLWASTHRGLIKVNMLERSGKSFLAPHLPFQPRGLSIINERAWVGTNNGLYSFEPASAAWRLYTRKDGLISDFVTDLVANDNYIWLGTNLGLTRIKWRNLY